MKTLLIATDFSANAKHAAEYGFNLAIQIAANTILCNAVIIPAGIPQAGLVAWPLEEANELLRDSAHELKHLKEHLEHSNKTDNFQPSITCINESGILTDVISHIIAAREVDLIITGTHRQGGLSTFLMGNHSQNMINGSTTPLMLVPPSAQIGIVKKIAFATDFKHPEDDTEAIYALIPLAKLLGAEILLTHIYNEVDPAPKFQQRVEQFMIELSNKADYPHIYYRVVKNLNPEEGLLWLCEHGQVDILAMLHRHHNFYNLLKGSHTQKMANFISIPLLILRADNKLAKLKSKIATKVAKTTI